MILKFFKQYIEYYIVCLKYCKQKLNFLFLLSIIMALLDSLGITLCIPLLNIANSETNNQSNYFEIIFENIGIPYNLNSILIALILIFFF